jgi:hypothetical protein
VASEEHSQLKRDEGGNTDCRLDAFKYGLKKNKLAFEFVDQKLGPTRARRPVQPAAIRYSLPFGSMRRQVV